MFRPDWQRRGPVIVFEAGARGHVSELEPCPGGVGGRVRRPTAMTAPALAGAHRSVATGHCGDGRTIFHRLIHALESCPDRSFSPGTPSGTYVVRVYAHRFPEDVSALVLNPYSL